MEDEAFYEAVALELERDGPRKGLWAKAFAKTGGNDNAAKALYIELRVAELKEDVGRRAEEERQQRERQAAAEAEIERQWQQEAAPWLNFARRLPKLGLDEERLRDTLIERGAKVSVAERVAREVLHGEQAKNRQTVRDDAKGLPSDSAFRSTNSASDFASSTIAARSAEGQLSQVRPWTRFWGRLFDIYVFSFVFGFVAVLLFPFHTTNKGQELLFGMLALFAWAFVEPVFLVSFGTTPGKWLMRIKLSVKDGPMSYSRALSRSLKVWWRGLGIGFPLVALFTMAVGAGRLRKNGVTSWDREGGFIVSHKRVGWLRGIAMAFIMFVFLVLQAIGSKL